MPYLLIFKKQQYLKLSSAANYRWRCGEFVVVSAVGSLFFVALTVCGEQWRSQNAEKVMHIKGRLLDQTLILFNGVLFSKSELFLKERNCSQGERILSIKSSSLWYGRSLLPHYVISLECYYFYCAYA